MKGRGNLGIVPYFLPKYLPCSGDFYQNIYLRHVRYIMREVLCYNELWDTVSGRPFGDLLGGVTEL